jgi:hypothetical protein
LNYKVEVPRFMSMDTIVPFRPRGRPRISRNAIMDAIRPRPPSTNAVLVRRKVIAKRVGCSPATVGRAIVELEANGEVRRFRRLGRKGMLLRLPSRLVPRVPPTVVIAVVSPPNPEQQ